MFKKMPLLIAILLLLTACSKESAPVSKLRVRVLDGFTDAPIENARVVVPETGEAFPTGPDGLTEEMTLPVIPDSEYDKLLPCPDGRATLIVYADGMTPYLLLYLRTGTNREPVAVRLFPDDGTLGVFTVIEAPPEEWAEELVSKWR